MVDENYFGVVSGGAEPARVARTPTKKAPRAARTPLQARDPNAVQAFEPEKKPPPATPQPGRFAWLSPGMLLKTERRYGAPKTVECECCYERVPLAKVVTCTKGQHACCHGCVSALVQARISEGSAAPLRCISTALCDGAISQAGLAAALASPVLRQRDAIVARAELARAKLPNMVTCPFCPYAVVVDDVAAPPPRAAAGHERRRLWTDDGGDDGRIRANSREGRVGVVLELRALLEELPLGDEGGQRLVEGVGAPEALRRVDAVALVAAVAEEAEEAHGERGAERAAGRKGLDEEVERDGHDHEAEGAGLELVRRQPSSQRRLLPRRERRRRRRRRRRRLAHGAGLDGASMRFGAVLGRRLRAAGRAAGAPWALQRGRSLTV
jgi:hypothetical protein